MSDNQIVVSFRDDNGGLFVLSGKDAAEFEANAKFVLGQDGANALFDRFQEVFKQHVTPTPQQAAQTVQQGLGGQQVGGYQQWPQGQPQQAPQQPPVDPWAGIPQQQAPPQQATGGQVTDRYGNRYQIGLPNAPLCQHGPMVYKNGRSQAGKDYEGWFCASDNPNWNGPRVDRNQKCQAQFKGGR